MHQQNPCRPMRVHDLDHVKLLQKMPKVLPRAFSPGQVQDPQDKNPHLSRGTAYFLKFQVIHSCTGNPWNETALLNKCLVQVIFMLTD